MDLFMHLKNLMSKKISYGRAILDIGLNIENRTLSEPVTVWKSLLQAMPCFLMCR